MRTNFSPEQMASPALKAAEAQLRTCVHCGICTATCPTYSLLRDERDGPRGRIQLIQQMLERDLSPGPDVVQHIDRCLSCLACVSACPSGVNYPRLIDTARAHIEKKKVRSLEDRVMRATLGTVLPSRALLALAVMLARIASPLRIMLPSRLRNMVTAAVNLPRPVRTPDADPPARPVTRVALHQGCVQEVIAPQITVAARRVLARFGIEADCVEGTGCCGALNHHMGQEKTAHLRAAALVKDIREQEAHGTFPSIVTTASGCGGVMRDYGHQLGTTEARNVGSRTTDIIDVIAAHIARDQRPQNGIRVAYHRPCSLQHAMKTGDAGPALFRQLGFDVVEPTDQECCGSAGVYNVLQPTISAALQEQKAAALTSLKPDLIVSGNIGCLAHIGAAVRVPVVHPVEVVDWALGGPKPKALDHLQLKV